MYTGCGSGRTCLTLVEKVTAMEIKNTIFHMGRNKSSGHDRFTSEFFINGWEGNMLLNIPNTSSKQVTYCDNQKQ